MSRFKNRLSILLVLSLLPQIFNARENRTEIMVDFPVNVVRIDPDYAGNSARIDMIVDFLKLLANDSSRTVTSVAFCGAASPEGSYNLNRRLAAGRLKALETLIRKKVDIADSIISRDDSYIPWQYLRQQVAASDISRRDSVIDIIDEEPQLVADPDNGYLVDRRVVKLKKLDNRRVWNELLARYFSGMRNASAVIVTYRDSIIAPLPEPHFSSRLNIVAHAPADLLSPANPQETASSPFYMDVRSNMLYDLLAIPNIGVEFYLGKNWSITADYMHAWWSYDPRHRYWRIYGAGINLRRWFGNAAHAKPLTGHHIGLYAQAVTFDFEWGGKAYMGGKPGGTIFDRAHFGAGIDYGYSLPVARRVNIDFSIGVGYIGGKVVEFVPDGDRYLWTATKRRHWFGPTKLEVSLVWLIGRGNTNPRKAITNPRKGGER